MMRAGNHKREGGKGSQTGTTRAKMCPTERPKFQWSFSLCRPPPLACGLKWAVLPHDDMDSSTSCRCCPTTCCRAALVLCSSSCALFCPLCSSLWPLSLATTNPACTSALKLEIGRSSVWPGAFSRAFSGRSPPSLRRLQHANP